MKLNKKICARNDTNNDEIQHSELIDLENQLKVLQHKATYM